MSLISRKLLSPDEVLRIENPYILVMIGGKRPAICNVPDISKMYFNKLNGMGDKKQNQELRIKRENERPTRDIEKIKIWKVWERFSKKRNMNMSGIFKKRKDLNDKKQGED